MILLRAQGPFEEVEKGVWEYVTTRSTFWGLLLLGIGILVLLLLLSRHWNSLAARATRGRKALFRKLAEAQQLTRPERRILKRMVRHYGLADPALIFVKRSLFEGAVSGSAAETSWIDELRKKLYG